MSTYTVEVGELQDLCLLFPDDPAANQFTTDIVVYRCSHKKDHPSGEKRFRAVGDDDPLTDLFEVVSSTEGWTGTTPDEVLLLCTRRLTLSLSGAHQGYAIEVLPETIEHDGREMYAHKVTCPSPTADEPFLNRAFWQGIARPATARIEGLGRPLELRSYYPHQHLLEIKAPGLLKSKQSNKAEAERAAFGDERERLFEARVARIPTPPPTPGGLRTAGRDYQRAISARETAGRSLTAFQTGVQEGWADVTSTTTLQAWNPIRGTLRESVREALDDDAISVDMDPDAGPTMTTRKQSLVDSVTYELNGQKVTLSSITQLLHGFLAIGYAIRHMSEVLKAVPKVGWYWDLDATFFEGKVAVGWGWREHASHEAYFWAGFDINVTLIEVQLEIGIGVSWASAEALVFSQIKGSIVVKVSGERTAPTDVGELRLGLDAGIAGALGARMKVPFLFEVEGNGSTELKLDRAALVFSDGEGFLMEGDVVWTGLKGTLKASTAAQSKGRDVTPVAGATAVQDASLGQASGEWSAQWVDPVTLGSFRWPSIDTDDEGALTLDAIADRVGTALYGSRLTPFDNVVVEEQRRWFDDRTPMDQVAGYIATRIDSRTDIRKDQASIDRIARSVYQDLRGIANQPDQRADDEWHDLRLSLTWTRLYDYVNNGELDARIDSERPQVENASP